MLTADQIRAARALVRWSAQELAQKAGVGVAAVQRMEAAEGLPDAPATEVEAVQRALEAAGVAFVGGDAPGVRLRGTEQQRHRRVGPEDEERGQQTEYQPFNRDD